MRTPRAGVLETALLCAAAVLPAARAAPRARWHHSRSPYRAVFCVASKPSHGKAGFATAVPVCGMAPADGSDLIAFDERGNQLPLQPLGRGLANDAQALVEARSDTTSIFVYFGSNTKAPTHKRALVPSLTLDVRTLPKGPNGNWQQINALMAKSEQLGRLFVDKIEQAYNPVDSSDACLLIFDGYLNIPKAGSYTFMLVSDDAGYLFIDNELLLARDGRHWANDAVRGQCRKAINLTAGPHAVRCVVADFGGTMMAVVARWISGKNKYALKPTDFVQAGRTRLTAVEARHRDQQAPAFHCKHLSYMSYKGVQYTETEFGTYNGQPAKWYFNDGAELEGATCRRVMVGLGTQKVMAKQKRTEAMGRVTFPEKPPRQLRMVQSKDYARYSELMLAGDVKALKTSTLLGYLNFLEYHDFNENQAPVCEALHAKSGKDKASRIRALANLARSGAREYPEKARKAFDLLLLEKKGAGDWADVAREYAEFAIYRMRDFKLAERIIKRMDQVLPGRNRSVIGLKLDFDMQQGKVDDAKKTIDALLSDREIGKNQRSAAVRANALRQRFYDLLKTRFYLSARKVLWEWQDIAPNERLSGSLSLARAKLLQKLGWLDGALGELDGAILVNPLLPNLPDVELERARIYHQAGNKKEGNDILMRIVKEFPNHPAAQQAKEMVR